MDILFRRRLFCAAVLVVAVIGGAARGADSEPASKPASAPAAAADPRVKPGESFYLEFPNLPKTRYDKLAKMQVCIPKNYDPHKQFPLYAWMGGADGTSTVDTNLVDADTFIRIGLPYPKGANNPRQSNMVGRYGDIWRYHKVMLDELAKVVPNISPNMRIIAGFSNGGHTIAGEMYLSTSDFPDYFNVYIPVEGGGTEWIWSGAKGALHPRLKGRFACMVWGEKSPNKHNQRGLADACGKLGMKLTAFGMEDTGHEFPDKQADKVRKWLTEKVYPGTIEEAMVLIEKAQNGAAVGRAFGLVRSLEAVASEKDAERLQKQGKRIEELAGKQFKDLKSKVSGTDSAPTAAAGVLTKLKAFAKDFTGTDSASTCLELLGRLGAPELEKLKAAMAAEMTADSRAKAAVKLRQFAKDWEGTAPADQALQTLQDLSQQSFDALKTALDDTAAEPARKKALQELRKFLSVWEGTSGGDQAKALLDDVSANAFGKLREEYDDKLPATKRDALALKVAKFQTEWKDTQGATDAQSLLDDISQQELTEFKSTWPSPVMHSQVQAIVAQLKKLQAKWKGTATADLCEEEIRKLTSGG